MKRSAVAFQGYQPNEISVVGYPQYDFLVDTRFIIQREKILAHMGFPRDARYIMYVSGSAYCPDEPDIIAEILKWIDPVRSNPPQADADLPPANRTSNGADADTYGDRTFLVIRPYLGSRGKDKAFDEEKFNRFKTNPKVFFYDMKLPDYLNELTLFVNILRHAHAVMAVYSTVLLEAAILGRPIVAAPFDGHTRRPFHRSITRFRGFEHFQDVIRFGALKEAFNFPGLKKILGDYLADPSRDADKRAKMCAELCYKLDGKASKRVADALLSLI